MSANVEDVIKGASRARNWLLLLLVTLLTFLALAWYYLFRVVPQDAWVHEKPEARFKYGSLGGEYSAGIPYWIFQALPRVFPDKFPGPGGYTSMGVAWEEGQDLPIGFSRLRIGFDRVGNNCAVCHTAQYRLPGDVRPTFVVAGPAHTLNIQAFFRLLVDCAQDPRFTADILMPEINAIADLSAIERAIYRFILIPATRDQLLERAPQFQFIYRTDVPLWGPGRDDPMNLPKYFLIGKPMDDSFGPADMPPIWHLSKYKPEEGHLMNLAGDSHDAMSVLIDSAMGVMGEGGPVDVPEFMNEMQWLHEYLSDLPAPKFPGTIDLSLAQQGKPVFAQHCARCHQSERTGTPIPMAEVGTDPDRIRSWSGAYAAEVNDVIEGMGLKRAGMVERDPIGYVAPFLDGVWLRAPYLHNGSVPNLQDLLRPAAERAQVFYRGYDLYDTDAVGFVSAGAEAESQGMRYDTRARGNRNLGHEFGTALSPGDKKALIEYLKSL